MQRRSFNWVVVLVGIGLAGVVAVSAAAALAARTAASPFELVLQGRYEGFVPGDVLLDGRLVATFTSGAPFCESGTAADVELPRASDGGGARRYTCGDGSGSLTLAERTRAGDYFWNGEWTIVEGSGRYMGVRGKGTFIGELLSGDPWDFATPIEVRWTLQGSIGADTVAPSLAFTGASAKKLRRPSGFYSIDVAFSLRDDVEGSTVAYRLRVKEGPEHARDRRLPLLADETGSTASGSVWRTFHFLPSSKRVRSVQLLLSASDPVGNEVSITRSLKLPRS
jgi:hypothetical protein